MNIKATLIGAGLSLATSVVPASAQDFFRLATLSPGSSPYMVMSTFAQYVNEGMDDVQIQVNATGAATQHALQAGAGQLDFFMMAPIVHQFMSEGQAMYANIPNAAELSEELRSLFIFPLGLYHIVTYADSGIETLEDIEGKTVFLGPPGGSATRTMEAIIAGATGFVAGEDYEAVNMSWDAASQAFQDGRLDVYGNPTLAPSPVIQQITLGRDVRLLGLDEEDLASDPIQRMVSRPGGTTGTIPAGVYGDGVVNETDVDTIGSFVGIGTRAGLSEEVVYEIVKTFWETAEARRENTPWLRNVTIEGAFTDLNMPLHPGAVRYYEEIGVEIPDDVRP